MACSAIRYEWIHQQFHYEYAHQPLADWQREFAQGQSNGEWSCLIALDGERLVGGAALARDDLAHRPDLGPAGLRVRQPRGARARLGGAFD